MEELKIRKARPDDLEAMLEFEQGIVAAERPFDDTLKATGVHYYDLASYLIREDVQVVLAELGGQVVGSGYTRIELAEPYFKHAKYAYLGFMYVLPEYRGMGIVQKIIETLKDWSLSQGITEVRLEVYANNLKAVKAYEKAGFESRMLEMRLDLRKME
eukprot:gene3308-3763_t